MKILVTGGRGFLASHLVEALLKRTSYSFRLSSRKPRQIKTTARVETVRSPEMRSSVDWREASIGVEIIVHTAGMAHLVKESRGAKSLTAFRRINVEGTLGLAIKAAITGVKRFIFISSIGVNGNQNSRPFTIDDLPNPVEPYAISKLEAEEGLRKIAKQAGMELVIIRPPLVYGPNAPGNFGRLVRLVKKGLPLPLGAVRNKRSLVAVDNLVELIMTCIDHPAAAGQTFLVSDGEDLSTPELIRRLARAIGQPVRFWSVPPAMVRIGGRIFGKGVEVERLIGSLQVDISHTCKTLGWRPPVSVNEAIQKAVNGLRK